MIKKKIQQTFCKHAELGKDHFYYEDVKYNEHFQVTQAMEYSYKCCLKCGKRIETNKATWVTLEGLEKESKKRFEQSKNTKII